VPLKVNQDSHWVNGQGKEFNVEIERNCSLNRFRVFKTKNSIHFIHHAKLPVFRAVKLGNKTVGEIGMTERQGIRADVSFKIRR
jgi:hypothetical protein